MANEDTENTNSKKDDLPTSQFCEELQKRVLSLHNVIWVHTQEENRAEKEIQRAAEYIRHRPEYTQSVPMHFATWTLTSGLKAWTNPRGADSLTEKNKPDYVEVNATETRPPESAIEWIEKFPKDIIAVFKDMHQVIGHAGPCRRLKDFISHEQKNSKTHPPIKTIVIISPVLHIPIELEKSVCVLDFKLPNEKELSESLEKIILSVQKSQRNRTTKDTQPGENQKILAVSQEEKEEIIKLSKGLSMQEFEDAVACGLIEKKKPDINIIKEQKKQIVIKNGVLELLDEVPITEVGGLDRLKDWLTERSDGWTTAGKDYGLTPPKGLLLLGVQGCGKSLISKAISNIWNLPNYKLDIGRLFNSTVGSSESITRNVLKTLEAVAPAVLLIDEIDKGMSGGASSGATDGGTTARVLGTILTWMNDRKNDIFIVATSNDVKGLPPELLRKGRFDEIFFVDLPCEKAREDIFRIHIRAIGRDPANFNVERLVQMTEHYSGAEIKAIVYTALIKSYKQKVLKDTHLIQAVQQTVPLWETRKEEIQDLIKWIGRDEKKKDGIRAMFASSESFVGSTTDGKNVVSLKPQDNTN